MVPLLTIGFVLIATLEVNIGAAVRVLVVVSGDGAGEAIHVGAEPVPLLCSTCPLDPALPPATSAPPPTTKFEDTVTAFVAPPKVNAPPKVIALGLVPVFKEARATELAGRTMAVPTGKLLTVPLQIGRASCRESGYI